MIKEEPLVRLRGGAQSRSRSRSRSPRRQRGRSDRGRSRSRERTSDRRRSRSRSRQRRRSRSSSPRRDSDSAAGKIKKTSAKGRKYRNVKAGDESPDKTGAGEARAVPSKPDGGADANGEDEEEEPGSWALAEAKRVEDEICKRVEAELASEGFQARVEAKLMEERAKLENKVTQQITAERRGLLQKERKRIAEEMKHRRELATIMEENQRKVQDALKKAEVELAAEETPVSR